MSPLLGLWGCARVVTPLTKLLGCGLAAWTELRLYGSRHSVHSKTNFSQWEIPNNIWPVSRTLIGFGIIIS